MSVAAELRSPAKSVHESRKILGPGGNRARVSETAKPVKLRRSYGAVGKPVVSPTRLVPRMSDAVVRKNGSVDSSCSTDSMSTSSSSSLSSGSAKTASSSRSRGRGNGVGLRSVKAAETKPAADSGPVKRCDWITANSGPVWLLDPLYIRFHDDEWGVAVHDDNKLYELLVLSIALAEHSWVSILSKRDLLRSLFDDFDPASVAKFSDEKLPLLCKDGKELLSEPKLRAVVENAKQVLKVKEEFGSFSNYLWRFMNNQPTRNGHRYARQVPVKTAKAELISKDMMRRGFRCVGPTVIYSFMQASGMANDHLVSCLRYHHCNPNPKKDIELQAAEETKALTGELRR